MKKRALFAFATIGLAAVWFSVSAQNKVESDLKNDSTGILQNYGLDEIVITGTRTEKTLANTPVLTRVLSGIQIRQNNFENIVDALEFTVPGLSFRQDGRGNNIRVQGLENKYVLILVDGERLSYTPGGNIDFDRLNLSNVKQIEVVKGASSALYGSNAIGMIINIITQTPTRPIEGWAKARYSRFNDITADAGVGFARNGFSSMTTFYRNSTDGYNLNPQDQQTYTKNPISMLKLEEKLGWEHGNTKLSAFGTLFFTEEFNPPQSIKNTHYKSQNQTVGASAEQKIDERHRMKLTYYGDFYTRKTVMQQQDSVFKNAASTIQTLRLTDEFTASEDLQFIGGAEYNLTRDYSNMQFGKENQSRRVNDINAFGQADWQILPSINFTAGARYTHHSAFGDAFMPKLNIMFAPTDSWRFRAGFSKGFKAPTATELYSDFMMGSVSHNIGNPDLKAEKSDYAYASVEYKQRRFNVSAEAYQNQIKNKIQSNFVQVVEAGGSTHTELRYSNIDDVNIRGIQFNGDLYPLPQLTLHAGYAYTDALDTRTRLQLTGNTRHALNWMITYKEQLFRREASVSVAGHWTSRRINEKEEKTVNADTGEEVTAVSQNTQDAFALWRITAQYTPWVRNHLRLTVTAGVQNIFNYTDPKNFTTFDPGRRFFCAVMLRF